MSLFDLTFIRQKGNIIFLGPPGVGKTHLAVSLALKACQAGLQHLFYHHGGFDHEVEKGS
jgi:DNA replication protein DnaC